MTPKQSRVLKFIGDYVERNGCSPSYQEIADGCDLSSKSQVFHLVNALLERGKLRRAPGGTRSLEVVGAPVIPPALKLKVVNTDSLALALIAARLVPLDSRAEVARVLAAALGQASTKEAA